MIEETLDVENFEDKDDRKLVTIEEILDVYPVPNSDFLDVVTVRGWQVVTKRGEHKVGDKVFYIEIDSILPPSPSFDFLEKLNYRIKTIRLRGQISQGIVFPLTIKDEFPNLKPYTIDELSDLDLTSLMGVKKYIKKNGRGGFLAGFAKGVFPGFLNKTDEPRLQNVYGYFTNFLNTLTDSQKNYTEEFYYTEKLDGTSMTVYRNGEFGVCSRNLELKLIPESSVLVATALNLKLDTKLPDGFALQGELIGPKIQGNYYELPDVEYRIYQIYDIKKGVYLDFADTQAMLLELSLPSVPFLGTMNRHTAEMPLSDWLRLATNKSVLNPNKLREGIVVRSLKEFPFVRGLNRMSFKVISNEFLLKNE